MVNFLIMWEKDVLKDSCFVTTHHPLIPESLRMSSQARGRSPAIFWQDLGPPGSPARPAPRAPKKHRVPEMLGERALWNHGLHQRWPLRLLMLAQLTLSKGTGVRGHGCREPSWECDLEEGPGGGQLYARGPEASRMWDLATEPAGTLRSHPGTRGPPPCAHHCHAQWGCWGSGRLSDHKKPQDSLISSVRRARLWGRAAESAPEGGRSKLGARERVCCCVPIWTVAGKRQQTQ